MEVHSDQELRHNLKIDKEFSCTLLRKNLGICLQHVLNNTFGNNAAKTVLAFLQKENIITQDGVPNNPNDLSSGLFQLFGSGSAVLERQITDLVCSTLRISSQNPVGEGLNATAAQHMDISPSGTGDPTGAASIAPAFCKGSLAQSLDKKMGQTFHDNWQHHTGIDAATSKESSGPTEETIEATEPGYVGTRDLENERKRLERTQQYALLKAVLDVTPHKMFLKDRSLRYVLVNKAFCDFLRRRELDIIGRLDSDILSTTELEAIRKAELQVFETSMSVNLPESVMTDARGETRIIQLMAQRLHEVGMPEPLIVGVMSDVTEHKVMKDQLREYKEKLERMVEDRTREITERGEETKVINESVSQRLLQKISQIDNISKLRDKFLSSADISGNINLVLNVALQDLDMEIGSFFDIDEPHNTAKLRTWVGKIGKAPTQQSYSTEQHFAEFTPIKGKSIVSKVLEHGEPTVLGLDDVHCAAIRSEQSVVGILALASRKKRQLDASDQAVLNLYSELVSTILKRQSLAVKPEKERIIQHSAKQYELDPGVSYLVKDNIENAYAAFAESVLSGMSGLCITREFPPKVRQRWKLEKTPIIWLSEENTDGITTIYSLEDISILVGNFLDQAKSGVVLLDGFEYLSMNHSFDAFLRFLQVLRSRFEKGQSNLIAPISEKAMNAREISIIEREMKILASRD